jgi:hypothetical protein
MLLFGSLAPRAEAQRGWVGRYRGYGYTPSQLYYPYSGTSDGFFFMPSATTRVYSAGPTASYGGYSFGPNLSYSMSYESYPGLPPPTPGYSIYAPARVVVPPASNAYVPTSPSVEALPLPTTPGR